MSSLATLVMAAFLASGSGGAAADTPTETPAKKKKDPSERVICVNYAETGSRIVNRRVCRTKKAWDERTEADQRALNETQARGGIAGGTGAGMSGNTQFGGGVLGP